MDERSLRGIKDHLQTKDAQERIEQHIRRGHSEARVTIGRAARLFNFSENQLRDWESRGLLKPLRSKDTTGQRQYSFAELDKLAIIRELIDVGYSPGEIPSNVDDVWYSIFSSSKQGDQASKSSREEAEYLPIEQRVERAYHKELFWRYYISHILRLAILLICEDAPGTNAAIVLPKNAYTSIPSPENLSDVGESLIGWLGQTRSFYTFFASAPSFEYPSDYRILPLQTKEENVPEDNTLIIAERHAVKRLNLSTAVVEIVRRLLAPFYEETEGWQYYLGWGMRDLLDPAVDFNSSTNLSDIILNSLANMVIRQGGCTNDGQDRWRFCCILLPKDSSLPLQQHTLIVRAQSQHSPHKVGVTTVSPDKHANTLSLKAYQSGRVIYRSTILDIDTSIAHHEVEGPVRSAIAVPIGGESGSAVAVLYVASYQTAAFSESHQRVLRLVGRMIEEAILIYYIRQQVVAKLANAIDHPLSVDPVFENFWSENDFVQDVEDLLTALKIEMGGWKEPKHEIVPLEERKARSKANEQSGEVVSFIAVDIDNQSSLAIRYGDQAVRNLSKAVGLLIQEKQNLSTSAEHRKVYQISADRFYLILKGMTLDEARSKAKQLRDTLRGDYRIGVRRVFAERLMLPEHTLELSNVTVRLGVAAYSYGKLKEMLRRYPAEIAVATVRAKTMDDIDIMLNLGQQDGGDVIYSWDVDSWGYIQWSST